MSEENKALVARMALEVFNQGKLEVIDEVIDEVIAPDFVEHGRAPAGMPSDREGLNAFVAARRPAFPDQNNTVNLSFAEADLVVQHVTTTGTMQGGVRRDGPHGEQATWDVIHIVRVHDGKIVEHWAEGDMLGMLQQLGFAEGPEQMRSTG